MRRTSLIGPVAAGLILAAGPVAAAPVTTELALLGPGTHTVELTDGAGTIRLVVDNPGTAAVPVTFTAYPVEGSGGNACAAPTGLTLAPAGASLTPGVSETVLTLTAPGVCAGSEVTVVVAGGRKALATTAELRDAESVAWLRLFGFSGLAALLVMLLVFLWTGIATGSFAWLARPVAAGPAWSFKDSWLTNVSVIGAAAGLVVSASGLLDELVPGVSPLRVIMMNLVFSSLIVAAPVLYATFGSFDWKLEKDATAPTPRPSGRGLGLWLAGGATIWGVMGQLGTLWVLNDTAADQQYATAGAHRAVSGLLIAAALVVVAYAVWFTSGVAGGVNAADLDANEKNKGLAEDVRTGAVL